MATAWQSMGPEQAYQQALGAGVFQIQHCAACDRHVFYPRVSCPHCGGQELGWVRPSGAGIVYSSSVVRRKPEQGGDLNIALIDLDEGVRLMSRVDGLAPERVRIGMAVRARIVDEQGQPLLVFVPAGAAA
ncbi:Zn-ribbon domain-containing OB-fold protein [Chromobacterium sp.]|uniref:Zn-ribbon domain-containing OB-fold protein n=1 Tax=Chromobacterium sp. TaxID=306190 RepID=UPI0035B05B85